MRLISTNRFGHDQQQVTSKHLFSSVNLLLWALALVLLCACGCSGSDITPPSAPAAFPPPPGPPSSDHDDTDVMYHRAMDMLSSVVPNDAMSRSIPLVSLSPYWDLLTSWTPVGAVLRLTERIERLSRIGRLKRKSQLLDSAGASYDTMTVQPMADDEDTSRIDRVWPFTEPNSDAILMGPFVVPFEDRSTSIASRVRLVVKQGNTMSITALLQAIQPAHDRTGAPKTLHRSSSGAKTVDGAINLLTQIGWGKAELPWKNLSHPLRQSPSDEIMRSHGLSPAGTAQALIEDALAHVVPVTSDTKGFFHRWVAHQQLDNSEVASNYSSQSRSVADALWVLAEHFLWGTHGAPPDPHRALLCYQRLADIVSPGNASAHERIALLHAGVLRGAVAWLGNPTSPLSEEGNGLNAEDLEKRDQARAHLHYSVAARNGHIGAQTALAFRRFAGIGAQSRCDAALHWYEKAAHAAHDRFLAGPPGGLTLPYTKNRLSDAQGGVYGPGASAASTGYAAYRPVIQDVLQSRSGPGARANHRKVEDMLEYYTYHADRGSAEFMLMLAKFYYQGSTWGISESAGAVPRNYALSREYLKRITSEVWPTHSAAVRRGGPSGQLARPGERGHDIKLPVDDRLAAQAGVAASYMGKMFLRGEGVKQHYGRAWVWFQRGADQGNVESFNGLGIMLRDGLGTSRDIRKAVHYFESAVKSTTALPSADAAVNLGKIHLDMGDFITANKYFETAIRNGNDFEAYYYHGVVASHLSRTTPVDRCRAAVLSFKHAVERGDWASPDFHVAERAWAQGDHHKALIGWMIAAERGYEAAQNNIAWVLDRDKRRLKVGILDPPVDSSTDRLALTQWTRSAGQDNVDALVKAGDYYFYGLGTTPWNGAIATNITKGPSKYSLTVGRHSVGRSSGQPSYEKAVACYSAASERGVSALASWNMGWMYEVGRGVPRQDFHLAKRFYDMALIANRDPAQPASHEASLPVALSLIRLYGRALWAFASRFDPSARRFLDLLDDSEAIQPYNAKEEVAALQRGGTADGRLSTDKRGTDSSHLGMGAGGDMNLPDTYGQADDEGNRVANAHLDRLIETTLICVAVSGLLWLLSIRYGVAQRIDRRRRELGVGLEANEQPFGWPPGMVNNIAGL